MPRQACDRTAEPPAARDKGDALGLATLYHARQRSLDRLILSLPTLAAIPLVALAFNAAEWMLRGKLSAAWAAVLAFWIDKLRLEGTVSERTAPLGWFDLPLPYVSVSVAMPDTLTWWLTLAGTLAAALLALRLRDHYLPLRYFILFAVFVQSTALLFFAVAPHSFPYSASSYVDNGLKTSCGFLWLLPWAHALTYYIFGFAWWKKISLTLLTLAFVVVAVPLQLALHLYILSCCSLLMMPLLSFVLGPTVMVSGCIALYGWAMSWKRPGGRP
ncbi:hypothetical protein [Cupriavidus alkaliphilus]|uniref:Uncharacterized protein n=1 Tax=Cupriavidus alkaliphilus TaxID=942866 RepID=A0A7W4V9G3_9BURK|nr:hypothetical protein [Cupriavidus alkaliphilus]MBB3007519.1 hypothetical protein [Cupriavidus alkaliphilus]